MFISMNMNKWDTDMADHHQNEPPTSRSSLEAATEAAARINALLIAKGILKPSQVSSVPCKPKQSTPVEVRTFYCKVPSWASGSTVSNMVIAEVDINNVQSACRNNLTRPATQEEIAKLSGASVVTKGRYMTEDELSRAEPGDRPLYLSLKATTQEAIDKAVARIQDYIDGKDIRKDRRISAGAGTRQTGIDSWNVPSSVSGMSSSLAYISDKLLVGLEHAPPNFDVKNKLLGPGGSYIQHIQSETGGKVMLRGRGSGFIEPDLGHEACEPMYIFIQHTCTQGLQTAKDLARNLIETVQQDYAQFQRELATMPPPPVVSTGAATLLAGLQQPTQVGLTLVGTSLPSSLSMMPVAAAITTPSPLGLAIGPPGLINPGSTVLLDTSLPPPPGAHFQPVTSQPPPQTFTLGVIPTSMSSFVVDPSVPPPLAQPIVSIDGGLMSTSFVFSQPPPGHQPGSLVLTHQPELASGTIVLSQPVVSGPPDSYVLAPPGPSAPGSFVLTQPAPAPGAIVLSQQPGVPGMGSFVRQQLVLPAGTQLAVDQGSTANVICSETVHVPTVGLQTAPVFSQAGGRLDSHPPSSGVSIYQIPSGSQLTVMQPPPGQMHESGGSAGPSAIYTLSLPPHSSSASTSTSQSIDTKSQQSSAHDYYNQYTAKSCTSTSSKSETGEKQRTGPRKRRFMEKEDTDFSNLLGYQHGPPHLVNTLTVTSVSDSSCSTSAAASKSQPETSTTGPSMSDTSDDKQWKQNNGAASAGQQHGNPTVSMDVDSRTQAETVNVDAVIDSTPVSQYSGKPQMYTISQVGDQNMMQPMSDGSGQQQFVQHIVQHVIADPSVNVYPGRQPTSYIYHQPATIAYSQFPQPQDPSAFTVSQPSAVCLSQDAQVQQTHYVLPPPPPSSMAPPQFVFGQAAPRPSFSMSTDGMQQAGSAMAPPPPPPPPPAASGLPYQQLQAPVGVNSGAGAMSYWMTLN